MRKRIVRFQEATLVQNANKRPHAFFELDTQGIGGGKSSPILEVSFNDDGTVKRFETKNSIYVQVKS